MPFRFFMRIFLIFICTLSGLWSQDTPDLELLKIQIRRELGILNIPYSQPWVLREFPDEGKEILDVAIIGGGMSGMATYLALIKEGVTHVKIFDENDYGQEGPWSKCARMNILRSGKAHIGPAMGIPSLTFRAWYEAQFGERKWEQLKSIPTSLWCKYLQWFREVLNLPIENKSVLSKLTPSDNYFELTFYCQEECKISYARKVVLATGREGGGGLEMPEFMKGISKHLYAHTGEMIDPERFRNKKVAIIGAGASAFDAAAVALENGAMAVDMLIRRSALPKAHKSTLLMQPGLVHGYYLLPDEQRCYFFAEGLKYGNPPPSSSLKRVENYPELHIHYDAHIQKVIDNKETILIQTNHHLFEMDYLICATGYSIDLTKRAELEEISPHILLWKEYVPRNLLKQFPKLGNFPYLGPHFEFLEEKPGIAPYLKNIHCFNYSASLSHGLVSSDISNINVGATRLAQGIAADFFLHDNERYYDFLKATYQQ